MDFPLAPLGFLSTPSGVLRAEDFLLPPPAVPSPRNAFDCSLSSSCDPCAAPSEGLFRSAFRSTSRCSSVRNDASSAFPVPSPIPSCLPLPSMADVETRTALETAPNGDGDRESVPRSRQWRRQSRSVRCTSTRLTSLEFTTRGGRFLVGVRPGGRRGDRGMRGRAGKEEAWRGGSRRGRTVLPDEDGTPKPEKRDTIDGRSFLQWKGNFHPFPPRIGGWMERGIPRAILCLCPWL